MEKEQKFGEMLREKRKAKQYTLRKFADLLGISPTYLSQVEQGKVETMPTAERIRKMAELLGENADLWIAAAGRVSDDLRSIIQSQPDSMPELLRTAGGLRPDQIKKLLQKAKQMKDED